MDDRKTKETKIRAKHEIKKKKDSENAQPNFPLPLL